MAHVGPTLVELQGGNSGPGGHPNNNNFVSSLAGQSIPRERCVPATKVIPKMRYKDEMHDDEMLIYFFFQSALQHSTATTTMKCWFHFSRRSNTAPRRRWNVDWLHSVGAPFFCDACWEDDGDIQTGESLPQWTPTYSALNKGRCGPSSCTRESSSGGPAETWNAIDSAAAPGGAEIW